MAPTIVDLTSDSDPDEELPTSLRNRRPVGKPDPQPQSYRVNQSVRPPQVPDSHFLTPGTSISSHEDSSDDDLQEISAANFVFRKKKDETPGVQRRISGIDSPGNAKTLLANLRASQNLTAQSFRSATPRKLSDVNGPEYNRPKDITSGSHGSAKRTESRIEGKTATGASRMDPPWNTFRTSNKSDRLQNGTSQENHSVVLQHSSQARSDTSEVKGEGQAQKPIDLYALAPSKQPSSTHQRDRASLSGDTVPRLKQEPQVRQERQEKQSIPETRKYHGQTALPTSNGARESAPDKVLGSESEANSTAKPASPKRATARRTGTSFRRGKGPKPPITGTKLEEIAPVQQTESLVAILRLRQAEAANGHLDTLKRKAVSANSNSAGSVKCIKLSEDTSTAPAFASNGVAKSSDPNGDVQRDTSQPSIAELVRDASIARDQVMRDRRISQTATNQTTDNSVRAPPVINSESHAAAPYSSAPLAAFGRSAYPSVPSVASTRSTRSVAPPLVAHSVENPTSARSVGPAAYAFPAVPTVSTRSHVPPAAPMHFTRPVTAHVASTTSRPVSALPPTPSLRPRPFTPKGTPFTPEDDELLVYLKEVVGVRWSNMPDYFPGRAWSSLQSRYSHNFSRTAADRANGRQGFALPTSLPRGRPKRPFEDANDDMELARSRGRPRTSSRDWDTSNQISIDTDSDTILPRARRRLARRAEHRPSLLYQTSGAVEDASTSQDTVHRPAVKLARKALDFYSTLNLTNRELGLVGGRAHPRVTRASIRDYGYSTLGAVRYMNNASGDVSTVAWSPKGNVFAAGAVAVTDIESMQYNKSRNLMIGNATKGAIKVLPDHKVSRPIADKGTNASEAMRNTQDDVIYPTVQSVAFSANGHRMYTVSIDNHLNVYKVSGENLEKTKLTGRSKHVAPVDLLAVSKNGPVATGSRSSEPGCITVFPRKGDAFAFSASSGSGNAKKYPSALKFGLASHHKNYLLAGFSCQTESGMEDEDKEGETCLWDIEAMKLIDLGSTNRNVFDLAWNPNASSGSTAFAIACGAQGKVNRGIHSVVRLYAPTTPDRARSVIELECPAWDINDVVYSPHDHNIIVAGGTDGKVYVWDVRQAGKDQGPLRIMEHGESLNVLDHEKPVWEADTGIRFLSWGADHARLYSGSSDGVVKCWDPYRSEEDKHVRDVVRFESAIMSGAFSPDNSSLLIGEEQGRLNLLTVGNKNRKVRDMDPFTITEDPTLPTPHNATSLLETQQIVLRPMGAMPIRQAVQGPNYTGPYRRDSAAPTLRLQAAAFQTQLAESYVSQQAFLAAFDSSDRECTLDCRHRISPVAQEEIDALDYTGRFKDRIPDTLRTPLPCGLQASLQGLNSKCSACGGVARTVDDEAVAAAPAPAMGGETKALCERCNFACFRCAGRARVSKRGRVVECVPCGLAWRVGVLGYELISDSDGEVSEGIEMEWDRDRRDVEMQIQTEMQMQMEGMQRLVGTEAEAESESEAQICDLSRQERERQFARGA